MKVWEHRVGARTITVQTEGTLRDTLQLFVDGEAVASHTGGWLSAENTVSGQWTDPASGERLQLRAWVGSDWSTGFGVDCKLWVDGQLVFEEDFFSRLADKVVSARRAVERVLS